MGIGCCNTRYEPQAELDDMWGPRRQRELIQCSCTEGAFCTAFLLERRKRHTGQNNRRCKCVDTRPFPGMDVPGFVKASEHIGGKAGPEGAGLFVKNRDPLLMTEMSRKVMPWFAAAMDEVLEGGACWCAEMYWYKSGPAKNGRQSPCLWSPKTRKWALIGWSFNSGQQAWRSAVAAAHIFANIHFAD